MHTSGIQESDRKVIEVRPQFSGPFLSPFGSTFIQYFDDLIVECA